MSRPNAKASTSPSTPSAPTTCKCSPGARFTEHDPEKWTSGFPKGSCFYKGPRPQLRSGHIPGNARTVEGLQRKLGPLSLWGELDLMTWRASLHFRVGEYPRGFDRCHDRFRWMDRREPEKESRMTRA